MGEKTEATKWFGLGLVLLVVLIVALTGLRWVLMPAEKMVERKALVESHQYKEGMSERAAILRANIAEIESRLLDPSLDDQSKKNLKAQLSSLRIQLNATTR